MAILLLHYNVYSINRIFMHVHGDCAHTATTSPSLLFHQLDLVALQNWQGLVTPLYQICSAGHNSHWDVASLVPMEATTGGLGMRLGCSY